MRARLVGGVLAVGLGALSVVACSDDDGSSSDTTTSVPATVSTTSAVPSTVTDTTPEDGTGLPDGEHFGYLVGLAASDGAYEGTFDLAYLYTGNEAVARAAEDGVALETDFYIRNQSPKLRDIEVDPAAEVSDVDPDFCCEPQNVSLSDFVLSRDEHGEERTAVTLTVEDGEVTEIAEVYLP